MAKVNPWFRLYNEIIEDEKLLMLAFQDRWHYVALLCLKNKGVLDQGDDADKLDRKVALKLGLSRSESDEVKRRLCEEQLISPDWQPLGWDERQFKSDSSTDRVRRHRQRMKRECNVSVTVQETETESETESEGERAPSRPADSGGQWGPSRICPADFEPNSDLLKLARIPKGVDVEHELFKFKCHEYPAQKSDWDRAFLKWLASARPPEEADGDTRNRLERDSDRLINGNI